MLARRDRSVAQLERGLRQRGYSAEDIRDALQRLTDAKALDDLRYAERFSRNRLTHGGLGRHRVRQALYQRGVPRKDAEQGLAAALDQVSETESIERLARLYWSRRSQGEPHERLRRLWAFLLRRGFPADLVRTRLQALWPRWRDALDGLDPIEHDTEQEQG